ncbi:thioesterase II family protein [Streptomyces paromomycinus]|uniref:Thioesterase n=1 Tax=Streptomyces paromomycinus TaxID=92743 RepID=A0A401VZ88_STREY|nr:alpha/beta fold hydrolase [Streptomyces paromomycinus]GCD42355.1 thioesterase [Streptomyces paromomycinus]
MSTSLSAASTHAPPAARDWLRRYGPERPHAAARLVCFPHAGGGASFYRRWAALLPDTYDHLAVQYPGREDRIGEECVGEMPPLADRIAEVLMPLADRPLILFGHSMGASIAYEVARRLQEHGRTPHHLVASSRLSPSRERPGTVHLLDDEAFLRELAAFGGISQEVLRHRELRDLVLRPMRSDYRLVETYQPTATPALECPVTAVRGDQDHSHPAGDLRAWAEVAGGGFRLVTLPGDHFYLASRARELIELLLPRFAPRPVPGGALPVP